MVAVVLACWVTQRHVCDAIIDLISDLMVSQPVVG